MMWSEIRPSLAFDLPSFNLRTNFPTSSMFNLEYVYLFRETHVHAQASIEISGIFNKSLVLLSALASAIS